MARSQRVRQANPVNNNPSTTTAAARNTAIYRKTKLTTLNKATLNKTTKINRLSQTTATKTITKTIHKKRTVSLGPSQNQVA
jgi:hypothetical protein